MSIKRAMVAATALLLAGCGGDAEGGATTGADARSIVLTAQDVATVRAGQLTSGVTLSGSLDPYQVVEVRAQVPGIVQNIRADRGDVVRRGAAMATIEAEGIRGQAAGAQASVAAAEANFALAQQQLESARTLYNAGAMSEIDFRAAQAGFEAARAQLAAARGQAAGATEQARRATIVAPISGQVSRRAVSAGEAVNPGQPLFTVVDTRYLELFGQVPVTAAALVRAGQPVEFTLVSAPGRVFTGEVDRVDPTADPATRQVGVYLRLPNESGSLIGGQFATGRVVTGSVESAAIVPANSIREGGGRTYALVIDGGVVQRRDVQVTGRSAAGEVAVTGLRAGERVIVARGEIAEGTRVTLDTGTAPATQGSPAVSEEE